MKSCYLKDGPSTSSGLHGEAGCRVHRKVSSAGGLGPGAYLDLALIFLLLRFSLRIRFLRHLARIVPAEREKKRD